MSSEDFSDGDDWMIHSGPSDMDKAKAGNLLRAIELKNDAKAVKKCLDAGGRCWEAIWLMDVDGSCQPGGGNNDTETVLDIAMKKKNQEIIALIKAKMGTEKK
jgi:hypothetical protein